MRAAGATTGLICLRVAEPLNAEPLCIATGLPFAAWSE